MIFYKRYMGDYAKDTRHLTMLENGAYCLLLDYYYSTEKPIPADRCERIANACANDERIAVQTVLEQFFQLTENGWQHSKCDTVILEANAKSKKAKDSASKRWNKNGCDGNANASETHSKTQCERNASHSHSHIEKKGSEKSLPISLPDWLPAELWADWHAYRNTRKGWTLKAKELSLKTLTDLQAQGFNPKTVIERSIERGWTGLFAPSTPNGQQPAFSGTQKTRKELGA